MRRPPPDPSRRLTPPNDRDDCASPDAVAAATARASRYWSDQARYHLAVVRDLRARMNDGPSTGRDGLARHPGILSPTLAGGRPLFPDDTWLQAVPPDSTGDTGEPTLPPDDLVLVSPDESSVLRIRSPGAAADGDALPAWVRCVQALRAAQGPPERRECSSVVGSLVADQITGGDDVAPMHPDLARAHVYAKTWSILLARAERQWTRWLAIFPHA
jgi:hypothetical protein